jgi:hypothetical protein
VIWWDYLLASVISPRVKVVILSDGHYAATTTRRSTRMPHPAAARLWESTCIHHRPEPVAGGQGPADRAAHADQGRHRERGGQALCRYLSGTVSFPSQTQQDAAEKVVAQSGRAVTAADDR